MTQMAPEGTHIRDLRRKRGLSVRALAARAGVSTNTVLRLERGLPTLRSTQERVAEALGVSRERIALRDCTRAADWAVHVPEATRWVVVDDRRKGMAARVAEEFVDDPQERRRLGGLGLVAGFRGVLRCGLSEGRLVNALLELYSRPGKPSHHPGEEFLYCLRGAVRVWVGNGSFELRTGSSATFVAEEPHTYEPLGEPTDLPALLLSVCSDVV